MSARSGQRGLTPSGWSATLLRMNLRTAFALTLVFSAACSAAPVAPANIERVQRGMTKAEVEALLGPPHEVTAAGQWLYHSPAPGDNPHRLTDAADLVTQIVVVSFEK